MLKNTVRFILPFNDRHMKSLENYVSTNIEPVKSNGLFECMSFCIIDLQAYRYLKTSLHISLEFRCE
jgi:hypothetical protein